MVVVVIVIVVVILLVVVIKIKVIVVVIAIRDQVTLLVRRSQALVHELKVITFGRPNPDTSSRRAMALLQRCTRLPGRQTTKNPY